MVSTCDAGYHFCPSIDGTEYSTGFLYHYTAFDISQVVFNLFRQKDARLFQTPSGKHARTS